MPHAARTLSLVALLSALAHCTAGTPPPAGQCEFDSDCDAGLVCAGNVCRASCRVDRDCGANARCIAGESGVLACVTSPVEAAACVRDSDCAAGAACLGGRCRAQCVSDYDCQVVNPSTRCASGVCQSICAAGTAECDGNRANGCERLDTATHCGACGRACAAGQVCAAGVCASTCASPRMVCAGACIDTSGDVANCGACGRACPAVLNGAAACVASACAFTCNDGYYRDGTACAQVIAPTLSGPASGSIATTRRPVFRWTAPPRGSDGARIQICRDRACTTVETTFDVTGTSGAPTAPLTPGVHFWRALGRQGSSTGTGPSTTTFEIVIPARDATRNTAWGAWGDLNADGFADTLVGEPGQSRAHVFYGSATGHPATPSLTLTDGGTSDFGKSVTIAGDLDADGFVDAAVGVPGARSIALYSGSATGLGATGTTVNGGSFEWGLLVSAAGDLNGDGFADLAVWNGLEVNTFDIVYGGARSATPRVVPIETFRGRGTVPIAGAGKINNDEFDDLVIASSNIDASVIAVFYGSAAGIPALPSAMVRVTSINAVAAAGDVNGDGYADVIAGSAPGAATGAWLFAGSAAGLGTAPIVTYIDDVESDFGASVSGAGDLNGDGFGDVVIGNGYSMARVYLGAATPTSSVSTRLEGNPGLFSSALTAAGDLDRDGFADLVIGSPEYGGKGTCNGSVFVFPGAREGVSMSTVTTIATPPVKGCGTLFGFSVAWNMRWPARLFLG